MWVYPNQVIQNDNWATNTGIDILLALGENDGLYIYNTGRSSFLELGMPQEVVNCELRVRSDDPYPYPQLIIQFFLAGNLVDYIVINTTNNWVIHTLAVNRWDSITLQVEDDGVVAVDFLRAEPYGGAPTKRTLTGVGI